MKFWKRNFLLVERLALTLAGAILAIWMLWLDKIPDQVLSSEKALPIISGLAALFSAMLGFLLAIIVFLLGLVEAKNFKILRASSAYEDLWAIFKGATYASAFSSAVGILLILTIWFGSIPKFVVWVFLCSIAWLVLRIFRVLWVLREIIDGEVSQGAKLRRKIEQGRTHV